MKVLLLVFLPLVALILNDPMHPKTRKRIDKTVNKLWQVQKPTLSKLEVADPIQRTFLNNTPVFQVKGDGRILGWICIREARGCKVGGCGVGVYANAQDIFEGQSYEVFQYALFLDFELRIAKVLVLDYAGDYGYEINSPGWLKQFVGYRGGGLSYGSDIQAISGATISANSITYDIVEVHDQITACVEGL